MSTATVVGSGSNFLHTRYDRSKLFLSGIERTLRDQTLLNSAGVETTFPIGTLVGRVSASGKLIPLASAASDGSQYPIGVLVRDYTVDATSEITNATVAIAACTVDGSKLALDGSDDLDTTVTNAGASTIRDLIHARTQLLLVDATELGKTDNDL
jgi:hypothetical protein